jgi:hypothetical protein
LKSVQASSNQKNKGERTNENQDEHQSGHGDLGNQELRRNEPMRTKTKIKAGMAIWGTKN